MPSAKSEEPRPNQKKSLFDEFADLLRMIFWPQALPRTPEQEAKMAERRRRKVEKREDKERAKHARRQRRQARMEAYERH
ncbi:hypothetical protein RRF57_012568 [Xylaria bambusicola]|uniref:Uncharacterized protein n=1 Tax=Xylaria bambusicola TaxID=326684 RepID=A0AAN7V1W1_9PEZI